MKRTTAAVAAVLYVSTIIAANWAVNHYGIVSVGFGYLAPAAEVARNGAST